MSAGMAGALLVFTGVWHATEWTMDGRRRDTWLLVPIGMVYLALGCLVIAGSGGLMVQVTTLVVAAVGGAVALLNRRQFAVKPWVLWTFIFIDMLVVWGLAATIIG